MKEQVTIKSYNVSFRTPAGAYFATFNAETGKMIFCSNSTISGLFLDKELRLFILYCRYNDFQFWG